MLEQFWVFARVAETVFTESLGYQMRLARCEKIPKRRLESSIAEFQRDMAVRVLAAPVTAPKAKALLRAAASSSATSTPLLDLELGEKKKKWAKRLLEIADRAGDHAGSSSYGSVPEILSNDQKSRLQLLVFTSGAPSTMANHIRLFEKFEMWSARLVARCLFTQLLTISKVLKYRLFLDSKECGPTVLPSLRTALKWVSFRINVALPSLEAAALKALEQEVFDKRGKPLIAYPIPVISAMEKFVVRNEFNEAEVFVWWILCVIFASLRFDDAIDVEPRKLEYKEQGIFGVSWQTKTESANGEAPSSWCAQFVDQPRDFWVPDLEGCLCARPAQCCYRGSLPENENLQPWGWHLQKARSLRGREPGSVTLPKKTSSPILKEARARRKQCRNLQTLLLWQLNIASFQLRGWDLLQAAERCKVDVMQETRMTNEEASRPNNNLKHWNLFHQQEVPQLRRASAEGGVAIAIMPAVQAAAHRSETGQWLRVALPGLRVTSDWDRDKDEPQDPLPAPTRWTSNRCIDWGISCNNTQASVKVLPNKWSDHKLLEWQVTGMAPGKRGYKLRQTSDLRKAEDVSQTQWEEIVASHWASLEPTRKGLDMTDWEQLSVAVEEALRGALRELGSQRRFIANNYKGREAIADCSHHRPSPQVRATRLRCLGRRLEQWHKRPDPQLSRHALREATFFACPLNPLDRNALPALRQWLQEELTSLETAQKEKRLQEWNILCNSSLEMAGQS